MDGGAWWAAVHGVTEGRTGLEQLKGVYTCQLFPVLETTEDMLFFPAAAAKLLQSCPTLCDPIDGSPPGSPIPGMLQARTLEWVAISFSNA